MLTLPRPVAFPPASTIRLWMADLAGEMSLARRMLKLAQEFEQTQQSSILIPTADILTPTPSQNANAR